MTLSNGVGAFMRRIGLKILYFVYVPWFMYWYLGYIVEDISEKSEPLQYALYKTIWLWIFRIGSVILLLPALGLAAFYLTVKLPDVCDPPDSQSEVETTAAEDENENETKKIATMTPVQSGAVSANHLACFIIRIITRGDYPGLVRRNAIHHIELAERHGHYDRLETHIVTEKSIDGDYQVGKSGRVREFVVPTDYKPKRGTLAKARNMAYWMERMANEPGYPAADDQSWILSLDEDVFLTDDFMAQFFAKFLPSGAHCSINPTLLELPDTFEGLVTGVEESFFMTLDALGMLVEGYIFNCVPLWFRGAAYVVRKDAENSIGYEYSPEESIAEDHAFGHYIAGSDYKIGYIDGWKWEGGAPSVIGLIKQRARWFRGHIYGMVFHRPMSTGRRLACIARKSLMYFVNLPLMINAVIGTAFWYTNNLRGIMPAGPCVWPLDHISAFVFANVFYATIFGTWHMMSPWKAALITAAVFLWVGVFILSAIHSAQLLLAFVMILDDAYHNRRSYQVTGKKEK